MTYRYYIFSIPCFENSDYSYTHIHTYTSQNKQIKKPNNKNLTHGNLVENQVAIENTGESTYPCLL